MICAQHTMKERFTAAHTIAATCSFRGLLFLLILNQDMSTISIQKWRHLMGNIYVLLQLLLGADAFRTQRPIRRSALFMFLVYSITIPSTTATLVIGEVVLPTRLLKQPSLLFTYKKINVLWDSMVRVL